MYKVITLVTGILWLMCAMLYFFSSNQLLGTLVILVIGTVATYSSYHFLLRKEKKGGK